MAIDVNVKFVCICLMVIINSLPTKQEDSYDENLIDEDEPTPKLNNQARHSDCWMNFSVSEHFATIDGIEARYADVRRAFHKKLAGHLDSNMIKMIVDMKGMAFRAIHNVRGNYSNIPSGLNLGGNSMVRRPDSIMFFYRMKLRNNTIFRFNFLENDLMNMTLRADISLNDLHLLGAYERSATHTDPSILFYVPTSGEVEVLMNDVRFKLHGHLRLQEKRLIVETIVSELVLQNNSILMTFVNKNASNTIVMDKAHLEDFLERLKTDLDMWIKDYLNDYFTYFQLNEVDEEFKNFEKSRIKEYNEYATYVIKQIKKRINKFGFHEVVIPKFTFYAMPNTQIQLSEGVVRGFDTIYKRSIATGRRQNDIRHMDMNVGFSSIKVEYKIDVIIPNQPATSGNLQLAADDLTAQLQVSMVTDPETVNLGFKYMGQLKPESLIVTGAASQLTTNYKHLLETNIIAIMTNTLIHDLKMLTTITRCQPLLIPVNKTNEYNPTNYEKGSGGV